MIVIIGSCLCFYDDKILEKGRLREVVNNKNMNCPHYMECMQSRMSSWAYYSTNTGVILLKARKKCLRLREPLNLLRTRFRTRTIKEQV